MLQNQVTAIFNHAEKYYELKNNPCKKIDKMGGSNAKELHFWTKEEFDTFIDSFDKKEEMYRVLFNVLFWTGCRVGEMLALYYEYIDFRNKTVSISIRLISEEKGGTLLQHQKRKSPTAVSLFHNF